MKVKDIERGHMVVFEDNGLAIYGTVIRVQKPTAKGMRSFTVLAHLGSIIGDYRMRMHVDDDITPCMPVPFEDITGHKKLFLSQAVIDVNDPNTGQCVAEATCGAGLGSDHIRLRFGGNEAVLYMRDMLAWWAGHVGGEDSRAVEKFLSKPYSKEV